MDKQDEIRELIKKRGLKIVWLAEQMGFNSHVPLVKRLNGQVGWRDGDKAKLAELLQLTIESLPFPE
jgi:hypothetical protein